MIFLRWEDMIMHLQMSGGQMIAVVLTGMLVVFFAIILLIIIIDLMGKAFTNMDNKKKEADKNTKPVPAPATKVAPKPAPIIKPTSTDDDEIIAVISSAVAMMSLADGKNYKVKSVKAIKSSAPTRTAWSMAGLRENTRPFRQR